MHSASRIIKQKALALGFQACGIAQVRRLEEEAQRLKEYLANNYYGKMEYMASHFDMRLDPTLLVPGAKSVIVVLLNYYPEEIQGENGVPILSKYAYGKDYHIVVKEKLNMLLQFIRKEIAPVKGRAFTDSAPIPERAWAVQSGLGWIGKNGLLLNRELGSFFFIGELIIDLELDYDTPYNHEHCGNCTLCLSACPTHALVKPRVLDSRRCISYLTIELKEDTPDEFKPFLNNRVFGCDICQDVCPWNRKPVATSADEFKPHPDLIGLEKAEWGNMNEDKFSELFHQSAVSRNVFKKFRMNINNCTG